MGYQFTLGAPP